MIVCKYGLQMTPPGDTGIYFICQANWDRKGSHCKYARWCSDIKKYCDSAGEFSCPMFEKYVTPKLKIEVKKVIRPKTSKVASSKNMSLKKDVILSSKSKKIEDTKEKSSKKSDE